VGAAERELTSTFANAAVGDFNGDGRDDIAVGTFSQWRYGPGGNTPLVTLRSGGLMPSLKSVQIGRFDTTRNAGAITFVGDRLAAWRYGHGNRSTRGRCRTCAEVAGSRLPGRPGRGGAALLSTGFLSDCAP
jgi:hypothetical protein